MNDLPYEQLEPAQQRRLVLRVLVRALAPAVALIALYYLLPFDRLAGSATWAVFLGGMVLLVAIIAYEARAIIRAEHPSIRGIGAVVFIIPLYLLSFATTYVVMSQSSPAHFTEPLTRTDAVYFSVSIFSTVGFGDITAKTEAARMVVTCQMLGTLVLLGLGLKVLVGAVKLGRQRRQKEMEA